MIWDIDVMYEQMQVISANKGYTTSLQDQIQYDKNHSKNNMKECVSTGYRNINNFIRAFYQKTVSEFPD